MTQFAEPVAEATYRELRAMLDRAETWINARRDKNGWASWAPEDAPAYVNAASNDTRAAVELFELYRDRPARVLAYSSVGGDGRPGAYITTWTGLRIGRVLPGMKRWQDRHGNRRWSLRVRMAWGGEYVGQSTGGEMAVKLRRVKQ